MKPFPLGSDVLCAAMALTFGQMSCGGEDPFPRPARDAIAKAQEKIREVYKGGLAKANQPGEKAALAEELMTAADRVGKDDASRLVLLTMARDLAVDADDARLAMKAVGALVGRFQPDGPTDPKEQIERGNVPWKEAETAPADKRLRLKVQAAEWYLRAQPAATGFDKTTIEKRLAELGEANPPAPQVKRSLPTGWVRIVNRKTDADFFVPDSHGPWRVELVGDYQKIRCRDAGEYLALTVWARRGEKGTRRHPGVLRVVPDAQDQSTLWRFEPLGDGYWRIVNRETSQCFEPQGPRFDDRSVCVQAPPRDDALGQQWRLEAVKSGE